MEAYQAYYNTNESSNNTTQVIQPTKALTQSDNPYPLVEATASSKNSIDPKTSKGKAKDDEAAGGKGDNNTKDGDKTDPKIINNIVHID